MIRLIPLLFALLLGVSAPTQAQGIPGVSEADFNAAVSACISAEKVVLGAQRSPEERMSFMTKHVARIQSGDFKYTDVFALLVDELSKSPIAIQTLEKATLHATGHVSRVDDWNYWLPRIAAKKAWYLTIRAEETQKMLADPYLHRFAIEASYLHLFGRVPTAAELQYWMPRTENWIDMSNAGLSWLYSANGAAELQLTVARARQTFSSAYGDRLMDESRAQRLNFDTMTHWLRERH